MEFDQRHISLGHVSLTLFTDVATGKIIGATAGGGPSATPVGASVSASKTVEWSLRDLLKNRLTPCSN